MDIQRYMGEVDGLVPNDAGTWVRYEDFLSALSKSQERVKELEAKLSEALNLPFIHNDPTPASKCGVCLWKEDARSILGAKEEGRE